MSFFPLLCFCSSFDAYSGFANWLFDFTSLEVRWGYHECSTEPAKALDAGLSQFTFILWGRLDYSD